MITFTNSNPAWGFNSAGVLVQPTPNVPFIEYDPATLSPLGWRIWGAVTNEKKQSQNVVIAVNDDYNVSNATLTPQTIATPIQGLTTASYFALDAGANTGNSQNGMNYGYGTPLANSTAYTQSAFFKLSGTNTIRLRSNVTGEVFDIVPASGATTPIGTITACTVQAAPNGWYRVSLSFTSTTSVPGNRGDHWTIKTPVADGTTGFWITGAQINTGPLAPYVPTTTLTASSTADVASVTGANLSAIYNPAALTVYVEAARGYAGNFVGYPNLYRFDDGTSNNWIAAYGADGNANITNFAIHSGGVAQTDFVGRPHSTTAPLKLVQALTTNDSRFGTDGVLTAQDTSVTMPVGINQLSIGGWNGYIRELAIFKSRRSNRDLILLTQ